MSKEKEVNKIINLNTMYSLTIGERVAATKIFDEYKGNLSTLAMIFEDLKKCNVEDTEWTKAGLVKTPDGQGRVRLDWNDEGSEKNNVDLSKEGVEYLKGKIEAKNASGEFTLADKAVISLASKIK
jgi:hypothetical protein